MSEDSTPVTQALSQMNIPHRLFRHVKPVRSLEQAARERGHQPEQIIRSILFRLSAEEFVLVLMAGPQQIAWRTLRSYLKQPRLTTASEAEVLTITGYELGAVSPFGLPRPVRVLLDESVLIPDEISIGSGEKNSTVIMSRDNLLRALGNVEIVSMGGQAAG